MKSWSPFHWLLTFVLLLSALVLFIALQGFYDARSKSTWMPGTEPEPSETRKIEGNPAVLTGYNFSVHVTPTGEAAIVDRDNKSIIRSLVYFSSPDLIDERIGLDNAKVSFLDDSTLVIEGSGLNGAEVSISIISHSYMSRLDVKVNTNYTSDTKVAREALIASFDLPVSEVYKKNRTVDVDNFSPEYWLNRQGVKFGSGERQALIYQTPGVSSLQLDYSKNTLLVNLEYCNDHPYIYFPYQEDNGGKWVDQSIACYNEGSVRRDSFSLWLGNLPANLPRLMMLPNGYLAGYVFTEHADGGSLKTHQAVYFGCDTITCAGNATGGFYGYRIPVTKSVFYSDVESHPDCIAIFDKPEDNSFLNYLKQLQSTGLYDICLHTPEDMNSDRATIDKASLFMRDNFESTTWIDHGMMGGKENRECFEADAFDISSDFYCADIWKKYGVKYFWNTAYEVIDPLTPSIGKEIKNLSLHTAFVDFWQHYLTSGEIRTMNFFTAFTRALKKYLHRDNLYLLDPGKDEALPVPLYWMNPTRTDSLISWGTDYESIYRDLWTMKAERKVKTEEIQIEDMIRTRAIFINHGYYIRGIPGKDLTSEKDDRVFLNPYFDEILKFMSEKRAEGDLMITTIRDLLDYQLKIEKISIEYSGNECKVINYNDYDIQGLSMAVRNADVLVDGDEPESRISDEERIFWYNIKAHDTVNIAIIPETGH